MRRQKAFFKYFIKNAIFIGQNKKCGYNISDDRTFESVKARDKSLTFLAEYKKSLNFSRQ